MAYPATFTCPKCNSYWWEPLQKIEAVTCSICGHKNIKPENFDLYGNFIDK